MLRVTQCSFCQHLRKGFVCAAFEDGTPEEILFGEHDHREPYPGDGGVRFEIMPEYRDLGHPLEEAV